MPISPSSYNPNIPQPTDQLSVSQGQILNNFGALQSWIDVNHADYASPNAGKHTFTVMTQQMGYTIPSAFSTSDVGLYNAFGDVVTNVQQMWLHPAGSTGSSADIPLTETQVAIVSGVTGRFAYLPSGYQIKFGSATFPGTGGNSITVNLNNYGYNYVNPPYFITSNGGYPLSGVTASSVTFTNPNSVSTTTLYWLTMGM